MTYLTRVHLASVGIIVSLAVVFSFGMPGATMKTVSGAVATNTAAVSQADVEVLVETDLELKLRFTDAVGNRFTLELTRGSTDSVWRLSSSMSPREIVFGNSNVAFINFGRAVRLGVPPTELLGNLDSDIVGYDFDDVTIFAINRRALAVGLWDDGAIARIFLAGSQMVSTALATTENDAVCNVYKRACLEGGDVAACSAYFNNGCSDVLGEDKSTLCGPLLDACQPPIPNIDACDAYAEHCTDDPEPVEPEAPWWLYDLLDAIHKVLREILEWLQNQ